MKQKRRTATVQDVQTKLASSIREMYRAAPNKKMERTVEREMARKLGGSLAKEFFV